MLNINTQDAHQVPDPDFWYWLKIEFPDGQQQTEISFESEKAAVAYRDTCEVFGSDGGTIKYVLDPLEDLGSHIAASCSLSGVNISLIQHYIKL